MAVHSRDAEVNVQRHGIRDGRQVLDFAAPILFQGKSIRNIYLATYETPLTVMANLMLILLAVLIVVTVVAVAGGIYLLLAKRLAEPIRAMRASPREPGNGHSTSGSPKIARTNSANLTKASAGQPPQFKDAMPRRRLPSPDHMLAFLRFAAVALVVTGCGTPPLQPEAAAPVVMTTPEKIGPVMAQDDDFVIVAVRAGDTLASLAAEYLGDAAKAWWISEFNATTMVRAGDTIVIPLRIRNAVGVYFDGYQTVPILCYHRFDARVSKLRVAPAAFEAQMEYLARNGYTVVPLKRLVDFREGKEPLPAKSVVITLDDGFRSTFEIAYPILKKFGFPATVFVYTDFVRASDALTWPQMTEMIASGLIEIQPHSKSHANLTLRLPGETNAKYMARIKREVEAPTAMLRERLGERALVYAYPYGDVNESVIDLLIQQKISFGVTVTPGGNGFFAYPYMLRRTMVFGTDELEAFKSKLVTFVRTTEP